MRRGSACRVLHPLPTIVQVPDDDHLDGDHLDDDHLDALLIKVALGR